LRNPNPQDNADLVFVFGNTGDEPIAGDWDWLPFQIVGSGDFNADGKADVLWHNKDSGEAQVWLMKDHAIVSRITGAAMKHYEVLKGTVINHNATVSTTSPETTTANNMATDSTTVVGNPPGRP